VTGEQYTIVSRDKVDLGGFSQQAIVRRRALSPEGIYARSSIEAADGHSINPSQIVWISEPEVLQEIETKVWVWVERGWVFNFLLYDLEEKE
jgi:hypothetical protein